jgi:hypothetical protein
MEKEIQDYDENICIERTWNLRGAFMNESKKNKERSFR